MLSGRRAFGGDSITETITAVLRDTPDWGALPSDTPESVRRVLRRCLQRDVNERLRDIGDARLELTAADADTAAPHVVVRSTRVHRGAWIGLGLVLGAIAAGWFLRAEGAATATVASLGLTLPPDVPLRIDDMAQDRPSPRTALDRIFQSSLGSRRRTDRATSRDEELLAFEVRRSPISV